MKRKRLTSLTLDFISAVDRPAQEPATAALLKRRGIEITKADEDEPAFIARLLAEKKIDETAKAAAVKKYVILTTPIEGHTHLIYTGRYDGGEDKAGQSSWQDDHSHPWIKDEFENVRIGAAAGHVHEVAILTKKAPAKEAATMGTEKKTPEELAAENAAAITKLEKQLAESRAIAKLSDARKAFYAKLEGDAKPAFLAKSADAQDVDIAAAKVADDVVFKAADGTLYRKSDDPRLVQLAKQGDEDRATLAKERTARRDAEYAKRASDELSHLPGDEATKVALLKSIDEITDTGARTKALEILKATDGGIAEALKVRGVTAQAEGAATPHAKLEKLAREHAAKHSITFEKGYAAVLNTDEGRELYAQHDALNPTQS